jgi:uncharacterized protein YbjT (DUF2867 family)
MSTILITGATGTIGTEVVKALSGKGHDLRAAARGVTKNPPAGAKAVEMDWDDDASIRAAVAGADAVFLLTPFTDKQAEYGKRFVAAAKQAGVKRIVKLSAQGCEHEPGIQLGRWHREVEKAIEASGIAYTFLRSANFMNNFVGYYPPDKEGAIYLPWGQSKVAFVDARDVGEAAARALTEAGHENKAYVVTASEPITVADAASEISKVSGRTVKYVDVPETAARSAMSGMGMPGWMVDAMMELHAVDKAGYAAGTTKDAEKILGRAPRTFAQFAKDHASAWKL